MKVSSKIVVIAILIALSIQVKLSFKSDQYGEWKDDDREKTSRMVKSPVRGELKWPERKPASLPKAEKYTVTSNESPREELDPEEYQNDSDGSEQVIRRSYIPLSTHTSYSNFHSPSSSSTGGKKPHGEQAGSQEVVYGPFISQPQLDPPKEIKLQDRGEESSRTTELSCYSSISGGNFSAPVNVTLACSSSASILYCLSSSGCCDPDSGAFYNGPFIVGNSEEEYCLTYKGRTSKGSSTVKSHLFKFASYIPDLAVSAQKSYLQTTQLASQLSVKSSSFGTSGHELTVINLKSHDPSPDALNLSCNDLYDDHSVLHSPSPYVLIQDESTISLNPNDILNVNLGPLELVYGENHITTIFRNFSSNAFACSTHKITLLDFAYFEQAPMNGVAYGDQWDIIGGFREVGFFEPEASVYRGPAGESMDSQSGQELRNGLLSIFYM